MKNVVLDLPTFGIIVATRVALGFGIGLLMADKLTNTQRRSIGMMLAIVGGVTTVPAAMAIARTMRTPGRNRTRSVVDCDDRLIGTTRYPRKGDDDVL
jgi:hypothetical protein